MSNIYSTIRPILRNSYLSAVGFFKSPANGVHILNGHTILNGCSDNIATFRNLLSKLSSQAKFINFQDAVKIISQLKTTNYQPDMPLIAFSWDDGFIEHYTHIAPVIEEFGVNSAFFINPNFVDGDESYIKNFTEKTVLTPNKIPMRWEHILDLDKRGHIIGAHTMDHFMIRNSSDDKKLDYQIVHCKNVIEQKLNKPCDYFAFPYGRLEQADQKSIDLAINTYKYVFSQSDHKHYFSFDGKVINRRHFEPFWPINHVKFFLSCHKK